MGTTSASQQFKVWALAVRAYAYPASVVPIVIGAVYAWYAAGSVGAAEPFHGVHFVLALIAGMSLHTACNLINDYYDYKYGVDRPGTLGGSGVLVSGALTARQVALGSVVALGLTILIGAYFLWYFSSRYPFGWPLLLIGAAGVLGAVFYTATKLGAKYHALGEPLVFLMMGVGMVLGAYFVQSAELSLNAVWISLPVGFLVAAILQANDTRDIVDDRESRITTASTLLGPAGARAFVSLLLFAPYPVLIILCGLGIVPWPALIALISLPLAWRQHALFWRVRAEKDQALALTPADVAKLHLAFGLLLALGILIGGWLPAGPAQPG